MMWITLAFLLPGTPIRKLSGLMSRYIRDFSWIACTRVICADLSMAGRGGVARVAAHHLLRGHADRFDWKLAPAHVEKVLQVGAKKVNDQHIVQAFLPKVMNLRNTHYAVLAWGIRLRSDKTYVFHSWFGMTETRRGAVAHRIFEVPLRVSGLWGKEDCCKTYKLDGDGGIGSEFGACRGMNC